MISEEIGMNSECCEKINLKVMTKGRNDEQRI